MLASSLLYFLTLKMEATHSSRKWVDFRWTTWYTCLPEDRRTLYENYDLVGCNAMWFVSEEHTASSFRIKARNKHKQAASSAVAFLHDSLFNPEDGEQCVPLKHWAFPELQCYNPEDSLSVLFYTTDFLLKLLFKLVLMTFLMKVTIRTRSVSYRHFRSEAQAWNVSFNWNESKVVNSLNDSFIKLLLVDLYPSLSQRLGSNRSWMMFF